MPLSTNKHKTAISMSSLPAHLAEPQLVHIERVVRFLSASNAPKVPGLGRDYWIQRLEVLDQTFALVISQKRRVRDLRDLLA